MDQHYIKIFDAHKDEIKKKFNVESIAIFGSIVTGGEGPESDIDILVKYKKTPGLFAKHHLELITGRSVDLVTENALKKQLRDEILKEAVRVA